MEKRLNMRLFATASLPTLRPSRPRAAETNSGDSRHGQAFSPRTGFEGIVSLQGNLDNWDDDPGDVPDSVAISSFHRRSSIGQYGYTPDLILVSDHPDQPSASCLSRPPSTTTLPLADISSLPPNIEPSGIGLLWIGARRSVLPPKFFCPKDKFRLWLGL